MHGLAVFEHYIVCDVHQIVDRTHAAGSQTLTHPAGGRADLDIAHQTCCITCAERLILDFNIQRVLNVLLGAVVGRLLDLKRHIECGSRFSGKADDGQAVRTVGCDLKFNRNIVQADGGSDVLTGHAVLLNHEYALCIRIGEVVLCQTQCGQTAEHTAALNAAHLADLDLHGFAALGHNRTGCGNGHQIAGLYILGVRNDLNRLLAAHIHAANEQCIGIFMLCLGQDSADNNTLYLLCFFFKSLHLGAAHGHACAELLGGNIKLDVIGKPFH